MNTAKFSSFFAPGIYFLGLALSVGASLILSTPVYPAKVESGTKILKFPEDCQVGRMYVLRPGGGAGDHSLANPTAIPAVGSKTLKSDWKLVFQADYKLIDRMESLRNLPTDAFDQMVLSKLPIDDDKLTNLSHFTGLRRLDLNACDITDGGIKHLAKLKNLYFLNLSHTMLRGETISQLRVLPHLETLDLDHNDLSHCDLSGLPGCNHLTYVLLNSCHLSDAAMINVAKLPLLSAVSLAGNKEITGAGLKYLAANKSLHSMNVSYSGIRAADFSALRGLTLKSLELRQEQCDSTSVALLKKWFPGVILNIKSESRLPADLFRPLH